MRKSRGRRARLAQVVRRVKWMKRRATPWRTIAALVSAACISLFFSTIAWAQQDSGGDEGPSEGPEEPVAELSDEEMGRRLVQRLWRVQGVREVEVTVDGGVAVISGEVQDTATRSKVSEIARAQEGIVDVRNELVLGGEVVERIGSAFERSRLKLRMLVGYLPLLAVAVAILALSGLLAHLIARPALARRLVGRNRFLVEVARQGIRFAILLAGLLIALDLLDATALVGAVFGAAGLAGLAIGFAFKDLIENYVASVLLSLRRPFMPNDHVVIDGHEGVVVSLNSRATVLMTLDGNHLRLPNALVFKSVMLNYTRNEERRFDFTVGVGVNEDLALARRVGLDTLRSMEGVLDDPPPLAMITGFGESSVTVQYLAWVNQSKVSYGKVKGEAIRLVKRALDTAGVDLPEPTYRVVLGAPAGSGLDIPETPRADRNAEEATPSQGDVSIERQLDRQIAEEQVKNRERNLLDDDAPIE